MGQRLLDDVVRVLPQQAAQWNDGSRSGITSGLTEDAVIVDAYFSSNPAKWLIVFADREEIDEWLDDRLEVVDYSLERSVLHATVHGDEAVAVTRDRVTATYAAGDARVTEDRCSTWLLTRSGGSWQGDWALWKTKPFGPAEGATALR